MRLISFITFSLAISINIFSQTAGGLGINSSGSPADSSAILDVSSTNKGVLIPRMTEIERNAISNPAQGLLIFNNTTNCFNFYSIGSWFEMCGTCIGPTSPVTSYNNPVCEGATLNLYASTVSGATGYSWTGPNGFTSTQQNPVINNVTSSASGTYYVVATGSICNSSQASLNVAINPVPSSSYIASPASAGPGQNVTFTPATSGATYNWSFQGGAPSSASIENPVVQWSTSGTYNISLTVTQNTCTSSSSATFIVSTYQPGSTAFNYTGAVQSFTVPSGVTQVTIECWGAQGGSNPANVGGGTGGLGGYSTGQLAVVPGQVLYVYVGGEGYVNVTGGWNGGGNGSLNPGGGGASDVRINGQTLNDRVIVAGGGGGSSWETAWSSGWGVNNGAHNGGAGGGLTGEQGYSWQNTCQGGTGGSQTGSGTTGGTFGQGGNGANNPGDTGGGGGGWYGGGGGGDCTGFNGSGGGGSSYYGGVINGSTTSAIQSGNGKIIITY